MRCMSRVLFWLRRFRLAAQGWHPQRLVRPLFISPSIFLAEVRHPPSTMVLRLAAFPSLLLEGAMAPGLLHLLKEHQDVCV